MKSNKVSAGSFAKALKEAQKKPEFRREVSKFIRTATHIYKLD